LFNIPWQAPNRFIERGGERKGDHAKEPEEKERVKVKVGRSIYLSGISASVNADEGNKK
jgi:hypothetical protein